MRDDRDELIALLLNRIEQSLNAVYQWGSQIAEKRMKTSYVEAAFGYLHQAEALIELLEVFDCGSVGGFDEGQQGLYSLEERFDFLRNKHKHERAEEKKVQLHKSAVAKLTPEERKVLGI